MSVNGNKFRNRSIKTRVAIAAPMIAVMALVGTAGFAQAQSQPANPDGRYLLRQAEEGWFRIDRETGQASVCKERTGGAFTCSLVPDDRDALLDEIGELRERIATLEAQGSGDVAEGEIPENGGGDAEGDAFAEVTPEDGAPNAEEEPGITLPDDQQIDEMMDQVETLVRRFLGMVQSLRDEFNGDEGT